MVPSGLVGTIALPRDSNRALGYGGESDCSVGSSKALGLSDQPPETARTNNYKNRVYFLSKNELRVLGGKESWQPRKVSKKSGP